MFVIDVVPFAAGAPAGALSYRSSDRLAPGSLVDVTLRGKRVRGVVVGCESVREMKGALKAAGFALKGGALAKAGALPPALLRAAQEVALYHAAPLGSALAAIGDMLPERMPRFAAGGGYEQRALEMPYAARVEEYGRMAARAKRARRAVLLVVPTTIELERLAAACAEAEPLTLSGALKGAKRAAALAKAANATGLVLATPSFLWTPIVALDAIALERVSAGSYLSPKRPYIDARVAADALARARGITLALGDYPLPLEWRREPATAPRALEAKRGKKKEKNGAPAARVRIIDARAERIEGEKFKAVPDALRRGIGAAIARGDRAAVLAVRKGYSPTVVCRDCGSAVHDREGRPLSLTTRGARVFRSADGSVVESADRVCDVCGSWNLLPLGIGVERVAEELREAFPDARIISIDADAVRTPAQVKRAAQAARESGTIVVGTELMLPFLDPAEPVGYAAIASADALLALPFWRARERLVHAGFALRERSRALDIATRRPEDSAFAAIVGAPRADAPDFFAEETALREQFGYPPFGFLIRARALSSAARTDGAARALLAAFGGHAAIRMPDRTARGRVAVTAVCKLPRNGWPDPALARALSSLPPSVTVLVNSESLW